jgi:hypothetical protein
VEPERGQVAGQAADGRGVAAAVVVEDHQQVGLAVADQVERLQGDPAGQRAVADHRHHPALAVPGPAGLGQAEGVAEGGRGVGVLDHVVGALGP